MSHNLQKTNLPNQANYVTVQDWVAGNTPGSLTNLLLQLENTTAVS